MAKETPLWMRRKMPTAVNHPAPAMRDAAKAIRFKAKALRAAEDKYTAGVHDQIAASLDRVADGEPWDIAFGLVTAVEEAQP